MHVYLGKLLDPKHTNTWFWVIALIAIFVEFGFHLLLPISISNDSYGYLSLSQNLGNPDVSFERSYGYPLLLAMLGTSVFDSLIPIILVQALMVVAIPLITFKSLVRFGLPYAVLGGLLACSYFYNFVVSTSVLTELSYGFAITVYGACMIAYFSNQTLRNLLYVIAACWLIALLRLSGSLHFMSLLAGIGLCILAALVKRNTSARRLSMKHMLIAVAVFFSISFVQNAITNRVASVVWPHFAFNWVNRDSTVFPEKGAYLGIIRLENGPAAEKLYSKMEQAIKKNPTAFETLKAGAADNVKNLKPEPSGMYGPEAVAMMMHDLMKNTKNAERGWAFGGVLRGQYGTVEGSKLQADAIVEAFRKHPQAAIDRISFIMEYRIWKSFVRYMEFNEVSFPTAYYQQMPKILNSDPPASLRPTMFKQWAQDLFQHTGTLPENRKFMNPDRYPNDLQTALKNVASDDLIGFGHYVGGQGSQILRACWIFIALGLLVFPFVENRGLLAGLLSASIVPPISSVFMSETDDRHLWMGGVLHIITAVIVIHAVVTFFKNRQHRTVGH